MKCLLSGKTFDDYSYVPVAWSGDRLPVCPHCGASPYDANYGENHSNEREATGSSAKAGGRLS